MATLVDEYIENLDACSRLDDLSSMLEGISSELGFQYYALLHHASVRGHHHEPLVRIVRYPEDWFSEFERLGGPRIDPVHVASSRINTGFCWDETASIIPLTRDQQTIFEQSRRLGLGTGFTVPANIPGEPCGSCSFVVRVGQSLPSRHLRTAELVGAHAFRAARRIAGPGLSPARPHLSRRELQCVELVAAGKSDWEIGVILGISRETARQYVKRARAAYDAVSRSQLAIRALVDGRIFLEHFPIAPSVECSRSTPPDGGVVPGFRD